MLQRCRGLGFADEAAPAFVIRYQVRGEKLERHDTVEIFVDGFVDDTHAALPEFFENFVMRDGLACHGFLGRVNSV